MAATSSASKGLARRGVPQHILRHRASGPCMLQAEGRVPFRELRGEEIFQVAGSAPAAVSFERITVPRRIVVPLDVGPPIPYSQGRS